MLAAAEVPRIVHIGCEAASFARDIGLYRGHGYARGGAAGVRLVPADPPRRVRRSCWRAHGQWIDRSAPNAVGCCRAARGRRPSGSPRSCARRRSAGSLLLIAAGAGAGVGQLAVVGQLPCDIGFASARTLHLRLSVVGLGRRRAAGDLLLRRRPRTQARVRRRRPARPGARRAADRGGGRRDGGARRRSSSRSTSRAGRRRPSRLGDPDGHRHRVRARRARGDLHAPAERAAHVPADPGGGRRSAGHHGDRRRSTPTTVAGSAGAGAGADGAVRAGRATRRATAGGSWCRWRSPPGRWCTPAGCTPRSPACCWASRCRCSGRRVTADRRAVRAPHAAGLGGFRGAGVRVLRRRGHGRRLVAGWRGAR